MQRWERDGLPIHRPLSSASGTVYAYPLELEQWIASRNAAPVVSSRVDASGGLTADQRLLRGRHYVAKRTFPAMLRGIAELRAAIDLDPGWAPAQAALAEAYIALYVNEWLPPADGMIRGRAEALQALRLDAGLASAYAVLGFVAAFHDAHWDEAERHFVTALGRDPDSALSHYFYGLVLTNLGRFAAGAEHLQRAVDLEPLSAVMLANRGRPHLCSGEYAAASHHFRRALQVDPTLWLAYVFLGWAYEAMEQLSDAVACFEQAVSLSDGATVATSSLACAQALAGRRDAAAAFLAWASSARPKTYVSPVRLARVHVALGDIDAAVECLEQAVLDRSLSTNVYPRFDPVLAWLQGDARFERCLARIGL